MSLSIAQNSEKRAWRWSSIERSPILLWFYLALVTVAELLTSLVSPQLGQIAHIGLLFLLLLHSALAPAGPARRLALALTLAPLIRVLSLSLPLLRFPQAGWYPLVTIPLLITTTIIIRQLRLGRAELGLRAGNLPLQLLLAGMGFGLGALEYLILAPAPQVTQFHWGLFTLATFNLLIFTGFSEELIFRGVLQSLALPALGRWALVYVALLFGVLHIGYLSVIDVVFVSLVGLLFAYIVRLSGSILGVTLAHGLTNTMLFLVLPYLNLYPTIDAIDLLGTLTVAGVMCGAIALAMLIWLQHFAHSDTALAVRSGGPMRQLRGEHKLSYLALAQRAGLAVRTLAEIEIGLRVAQPDEVRLIATALGVAPEALRLGDQVSAATIGQ